MAGGTAAMWPFGALLATNGQVPAAAVSPITSGASWPFTAANTNKLQAAPTIADLQALLAVIGQQLYSGQNEQQFLSRVVREFGLVSNVPARFAWSFSDFTGQALGDQWATFGAPAVSTAVAGGVINCPAGTNVIFKSLTGWLQNPRSSPWAVGGRARAITGTAAGDLRRFSLSDGSGNNEVSIGLHQAVSATKWSFRLGTGGVFTSALSTVDFENIVMHTFFLFSIGTAVYGSVDGETPVLITTTMTNLPNVVIYERHGCDSSNGAFQLDAAFAAVVGP